MRKIRPEKLGHRPDFFTSACRPFKLSTARVLWPEVTRCKNWQSTTFEHAGTCRNFFWSRFTVNTPQYGKIAAAELKKETTTRQWCKENSHYQEKFNKQQWQEVSLGWLAQTCKLKLLGLNFARASCMTYLCMHVLNWDAWTLWNLHQQVVIRMSR